MKEERSIFTDTSFPVSPKNTFFKCAEKAAAVKGSPFLFYGECNQFINVMPGNRVAAKWAKLQNVPSKSIFNLQTANIHPSALTWGEKPGSFTPEINGSFQEELSTGQNHPSTPRQNYSERGKGAKHLF